MTISDIFGWFLSILNIFTFHDKPFLKYSVYLVNFLIFFSSTDIFFKFLPTGDHPRTSRSFFENKCHKNIYHSIQYVRFFPKNVIILINLLDLLTFQINFHTHRRHFLIIFRTTNIFNFHAQQSQKFSQDLANFVVSSSSSSSSSSPRLRWGKP